LRVALFPGLFVGFVFLSLFLFDVMNPVQVGLGVFFGTIPLFFLLERMLPWSESWLGSQGDVHVDVGLTALAGVVAPLVDASTQIAAIAIAGWVGAQGLASIWPTDWPLLLLGVPAEVLALRFVMGRVIGRFQHCNLDVRLGPLDYLFSSPLNHRWHHSRDLAEAAHNYGGDVIVWDHVFRTFYLPGDRARSP
jgi:hypothetical protein